MNYELLAAAEGRPLNYGALVRASTSAQMVCDCGNTLQVWLKIRGGIISNASFVSNGCEDSVICCSTAARMVENRRLEEAAEITPEKILAAAPPIAETHHHCAQFAADLIRQAIAAYSSKSAKVTLGQRIKKGFGKVKSDA